MTKKTFDPRSAIKKAKDAAYAKLPPAIICKPLQFIRQRTMVKVTNPATGHSHWANGPEFSRARNFADRGDGAAVQSMARNLAQAA